MAIRPFPLTIEGFCGPVDILRHGPVYRAKRRAEIATPARPVNLKLKAAGLELALVEKGSNGALCALRWLPLTQHSRCKAFVTKWRRDRSRFGFRA